MYPVSYRLLSSCIPYHTAFCLHVSRIIPPSVFMYPVSYRLLSSCIPYHTAFCLHVSRIVFITLRVLFTWQRNSYHFYVCPAVSTAIRPVFGTARGSRGAIRGGSISSGAVEKLTKRILGYGIKRFHFTTRV